MDLLMLDSAYILYAFNIRGHITIVTTSLVEGRGPHDPLLLLQSNTCQIKHTCKRPVVARYNEYRA